jgi:hypothetical protein
VVHLADAAGNLAPRAVVLGATLPGDLIVATGVGRFDKVAVWDAVDPSLGEDR